MNDGEGKFESDSLTEAYFDRNQAAMLAASLAEQLGDGLCLQRRGGRPYQYRSTLQNV